MGNKEIPIKYNAIDCGKVTIHSDVWIGCGVRILAGVEIFSHSIVAAGCVVTKDVSSDTLVAGVPNKIIKKFDLNKNIIAMKVLVTGGAGFIGSNLCEYLLSNNYEVVCLDNFSTGKIENIHHLLNTYPNTFKLIVGDIRNLADCQKALNRVDYVMHEAALGSVPRSIKDPITTNAVNIGGF